jgi:16S rRNA (guanine527-N7)-methyltransferase
METFTSVSAELRNPLSESQFAQLDQYASLMLGANAVAGLMSSSATREEIYRRHFSEALATLSAIEARGIATTPLIDIGTGGGLPGIVLKIARPDMVITLLEATRKKAEFLTQAVDALGLEGVTVVRARAESAGQQAEYRGAFQLATARAVAPLPVLLELALPLVGVGGHLVAMKGSGAADEARTSAAALEMLGGEIEDVVAGESGGENSLHLVIVRKIAETPEKYPRRPGMPAKRPL